MSPLPGKEHHQDTKTPSKDPSTEEERVTSAIVDAAIKVRRALGPGLLESVYEACLSHELRARGFRVEAQVPVPIRHEGLTIEGGLRLDLLVEGLALVELKAIERALPVHEAQLLSCVKLSARRLGFLLNFNVSLMKDGISRFAL